MFFGRRGAAAAAGLIAGSIILSGCSRAVMNQQIAEAIGTTGRYENNEPVETPQMKVERELREAESEAEEKIEVDLDRASALCHGYFYDEAIAFLEGLPQEEREDQRVVDMLASCNEGLSSLTAYDGDIPHLCFPQLIEDSMRAFDGDGRAQTYASTMLTTKEFKDILQSLYDNDYILIDIHSFAALETDGRGVTTMEPQQLLLPPGKRPVVLSQDDLCYSEARAGDGMATALALDENGEVKAVYTDEEGHDLKGNYDLIPIVDAFVAEHPDFSYRGAKGIVSVSAKNGVFGYYLEDTVLASAEENRETVRGISEKLRQTGWLIACAGYSHSYMDSMTVEQLEEEIGQWKEALEPVAGSTDILFYPYGAEVEYPSQELNYLVDEGLVYLCGLWGDTDFREIGDNYMRMTRRFIDGYALVNAPAYFTDFFDGYAVMDENR